MSNSSCQIPDSPSQNSRRLAKRSRVDDDHEPISPRTLQKERIPSVQSDQTDATVFLSPVSLQGDSEPHGLANSHTNEVRSPETVKSPSTYTHSREILSVYSERRTSNAETSPVSHQKKPKPSNRWTNVSKSSLPKAVSLPRRDSAIEAHRARESAPRVEQSSQQASSHTASFSASNHHQATSLPPPYRSPLPVHAQLPLASPSPCCIIHYLLQKPFHTLPRDQKKYVISQGKPCVGETTGMVQSAVHSIPWITTCNLTNTFFCWPCLLFSPNDSHVTFSMLHHALLPIHQNCNALLAKCKIQLQSGSLESNRSDQLALQVSSTTTSENLPKAHTNSFDSEMTSKDRCIIDLLERHRFLTSVWTPQRRAEIIKEGRPCPPLKLPTSNPNYDQNDYKDLYSRFRWLAGSRKLNKFFCWPCLLFASNVIKIDRIDMVNSSAKEHRLMKTHMTALINLKDWEQKISGPCRAVAVDLKKENAYLKRLISVVSFVKKESCDSFLEESTIIGLMEQITSFDGTLKRDLHGKLISGHLQILNDTYACLQRVIENRILKEISEAPYVTLVLEDISNIVNKSFIAVFVCYVLEDGSLCERFLCFNPIGYDRSSGEILKIVTNAVKRVDAREKLIGIAYNGTVLDPFQTRKFHSDLKSVCPMASFFNHGGHDLRRILLQSLSHVEEFRYLLQPLDFDLAKVAKRRKNDFYNLDILKSFNDKGSQWFFELLASNYESLSKHFDDLEKDGNGNQSGRQFKNARTQFLVILLAKVFAKIDQLAVAFKSREHVRRMTSQYILSLLTIEAEGYGKILEAAKTSMPTVNFDLPQDSVWFKETTEKIVKYVAEVVSFRTQENSLTILQDFFRISRDELSQALRRSDFQFHIEKLFNQLDFTNRSHFKDKSPQGLVKSILNLRMSDTLAELHGFLRLVINISPERNVESSSIEKLRNLIKTPFFISDVDRARIKIESSLLRTLQKEPHFYDEAFDSYEKIIKEKIEKYRHQNL